MKKPSYKALLTDQMNALIKKFNNVYLKYKPQAPNYAQLQQIKGKVPIEDINEIFMHGIHHQHNFPIRFPDNVEVNNSPINILTNVMPTSIEDEIAITPFRSEGFKHVSQQQEEHIFPSVPITNTAGDNTKLKYSPKLKQSQRIQQLNQLGISPIVQNSIKSPRESAHQHPTLINNTDKEREDTSFEEHNIDNGYQVIEYNTMIKQNNEINLIKEKQKKQEIKIEPVKTVVRNDNKQMNNIRYYKNQLLEQRKKAVQLQQQLKDQKQENLQLQREKQRLLEEIRTYR